MVLVVAIVVVVLLIVLALLFNSLVRARNRVDNAWSQIDVQLKRRHDLIPNLVETVKGYASHERQTFEAVTAARNSAVTTQKSGTVNEVAGAENALTGALKSLFAVAEAYPDLKADKSFLALQEELTSTEDRVAYARQFYNDSVLSYNNAIQTLPRNVLAGAFNFSKKEFFEADPSDTDPVSVKF